MRSLDKEIKKTSSMQRKLKEQIDIAIPLILQEFNAYVRQIINSTLPSGYFLREAQKAIYNGETDSFFIVPGDYQTPNGRPVTPEVTAKVPPLLRIYEETHPKRFVVDGGIVQV